MCRIIIIISRIGKIKCKEKKNFKVIGLTKKPVHIHWVKISPNLGITLKLVITVAPQYDICPKGKVYPKKAIALIKSQSLHPDLQVSALLKDFKIIPRNI